MSEIEASSPEACREVGAGTALRIRAMLRGPAPVERANEAARRLLGLVVEWGPDTLLDFRVGSGGRGGAVASLALGGETHPSLFDDLRWALQDVASLRLTRPITAAAHEPVDVWELVARRSQAGGAEPSELNDSEDVVRDEMLRSARVRVSTPWPQPRVAGLDQLLGLNLSGGARLSVRYLLSGATALESQMLHESLSDSFDSPHFTLPEYLGRPVRLRAFVTSQTGVPARARTVLMDWGTGLDLVRVPKVPSASNPVDLVGHCVPYGMALALVRVPAAGDEPFPGIATMPQPLRPRTLDPLPSRPATPVRLGRAVSASQRRIEVAVDLNDLLQHCYVQGMSGSGKSTFLATVATSVLDAGGSVTLLDPEGSTVDSVVHQVTADQASKLRVIRHGSDDLDVPINVMAGDQAHRERMIGMFIEMIQRAQDPNQEGMVGPRWKRWFTLIATATSVHLGANGNLVNAMAVASDMQRVKVLAKAVSGEDPELAHRLLHEYGRLEGKEATELISWGVSKLTDHFERTSSAGSSVLEPTVST